MKPKIEWNEWKRRWTPHFFLLLCNVFGQMHYHQIEYNKCKWEKTAYLKCIAANYKCALGLSFGAAAAAQIELDGIESNWSDSKQHSANRIEHISYAISKLIPIHYLFDFIVTTVVSSRFFVFSRVYRCLFCYFFVCVCWFLFAFSCPIHIFSIVHWLPFRWNRSKKREILNKQTNKQRMNEK